ncbi:MAG TPA: MFS transporter [Candidatus Dormibacteraeota bacterium]|nr:MFS transporter [Candidatus Dormibacteraeota bacterium]
MTANPVPEGAPQPGPAVDWRRNLAALWFAQVTAIFGFSFAFPFLPVYLRELGVHDAGQLALWTGVAGGASGAALAVMSPIWGVLADRYGRRAMLLRAMVGAGLTVGLMGFARGPLDLVALRLVQGATSGTVAAATALVASGTPRHRVGWALGVLSSAVAVGSALGPLVGGLAAAAFGVRAIFWGGGVLLAFATLPVLLVVREVPVKRSEESDQRSATALLREQAPGALGAIAALLVCQALLQVSYSGSQPLVVLRLLEHLSTGVEAVTGVAFAAAGLASALASVAYVGIARRLGYRVVGVLAALLMASAQLLFGWGPGIVPIVGGAALAGLFYGTLGPVISTMIGLETPAAAQARVFGVGASATAIGFALGPFGGGVFAAQLGTSAAITLCAAAAALLAIVLAAGAREPAR